jgi:hypothetical protein
VNEPLLPIVVTNDEEWEDGVNDYDYLDDDNELP